MEIECYPTSEVAAEGPVSIHEVMCKEANTLFLAYPALDYWRKGGLHLLWSVLSTFRKRHFAHICLFRVGVPGLGPPVPLPR